MDNGRRDAGNEAEFITFQDASKEFGIYPSTIRTWLRSGLLGQEYVKNVLVQRGALIRAIDAVATAADRSEGVERPSLAEINLARRILEICTSDADAAAKLNVVESVARSLLDRVP